MQNYEPLNKCDYEEQLHFTLSRISHEIRNPVTLISSSLQIIEAEHPEVKDFQFWDDVKGDLSYLLTLLDDLSSYNNGNSLTLECFKPGPWLKDLLLRLVLLKKQETPALCCQIQPDLPAITADPVKLRQLLTNLVRNALETGCTSLTFSAFLDSGSLKMTLSDNGPGIPEEYQPTLFDPFVTHKSGGTGLGLALSRKIAEAHGGQLLLSSSNSSGTCFTVILPTKMAASTKPSTNPPT